MGMGRVALVTGGGRGIGKHIALELAARRYHVAISYNKSGTSAMDVCDMMQHLGVDAFAVQCDVTNPEQVAEMFVQIEGNLGAVDILVNNAGITRDNLLMRMKDEEWQDVIAANLTSVFYCTKQAIKKMVKARWGRIINISSVVGLIGNPGQSNYCASKAGIVGFTKAVAREYGARGITANAIAPGFIESDMTSVLKDEIKQSMLAQIPLGRAGTPDDVARVAAFLASDDSAYVTGQVIAVDGGMTMC
jgi:3-oxoacyl-[acyl-carrier protein] reductase